jgi:DNA primase
MRDPDDNLVVLFKYMAMENSAKSLEAGRPIFDDVEVCIIQSPGNKDVKTFRSTDITRWVDDQFTGQQRQQSYAERFQHQYRQFKANAAQTKTGTPLEHAPFLTDGRRAELRAQLVYTVEQLAGIEGNELKNLGPGGREMKNKAEEYIAEARGAAPNKQMLAELEMLKARNAVLEEDAVIKARNAEQSGEGEFAGMDLAQLREYIRVNSGQEPIGANNMNRKTLVRLAQSLRPEKVA